MQCSVWPRSHSPVPMRSFTQVSNALYSKPQASSTSNATGRWVFAPGRFQHGAMVLVQENRLASRRQHAVLRLAAQPFAGPHAVFHPGEQCLVLEAPGFQHKALLTWVKDR